jgi:hypothetical protein
MPLSFTRPRPRITSPSLIRDGVTCLSFLRQKDAATKACCHDVSEILSCLSALRGQFFIHLFPRGREICSRNVTNIVRGGVVSAQAARPLRAPMADARMVLSCPTRRLFVDFSCPSPTAATERPLAIMSRRSRRRSRGAPAALPDAAI